MKKEKQNKKEKIKGMLILLNKLIWKIPSDQIRFIIAEASDIPLLNGYFYFDVKKEKVMFKKITKLKEFKERL